MCNLSLVVGVTSPAWRLFGIACGVGLLITFGWLWLTRDRIDDAELGAVVFSDEVDVRLRRGPDDPFSFVSKTFGWPRLLIRKDTIAIRAPGVPKWLASTMMMNYTLDTADCELDVASIYRWHPLAPRRDEFVVLRTTDNRGWLELGIRPKTTSLADLKKELIHAGARPAGHFGTVKQQSGSPRSPEIVGTQAPSESEVKSRGRTAVHPMEGELSDEN